MSPLYQNQSVNVELMSCVIMDDKISVFNMYHIILNHLSDSKVHRLVLRWKSCGLSYITNLAAIYSIYWKIQNTWCFEYKPDTIFDTYGLICFNPCQWPTSLNVCFLQMDLWGYQSVPNCCTHQLSWSFVLNDRVI